MDAMRAPLGYRVARAVLCRPLNRAYDIEVEASGVLPPGPVILAANHRSFMDSIFLASVLDRQVCFLAKAEYFDRRATSWLFRSTGQIPVRRGSPAGARQAMDAAREVLDGGGIVGVYPEGTRSRDGRLQRGHLGPARLARASGAPIVPVGILGTEYVQAPGQRLPRRGGTVRVRFGSPRWPEPWTAGQGSLRELTDLVMADIALLCEQQHGERFATV